MARLILPILLITARRGGHDGFAAGIPAAKAFAPSSALRREAGIVAARRRPPPSTRRRAVDATPLRVENSPSDDEPLGVAAAAVGSTRWLLPATAAATLSLATVAALTQHLPGPPIDATAPPPFFATLPYGVIFSGACDPYSPSLICQDLGTTVLSVVLAGIFVKTITTQAALGNLQSRDSRKIIHTLSAPLFILLWPLFSNAYGARVFASIVPLLNALKLIIAGTDEQSTGSESELAGAISRSGDAKEALGGPFIYVMVLLFATFFCWTDSAIGIVSVATMAVGDGLADLIGRRFGSSNKWSFNKSKSMAGSAAFVAGSFVGSLGLISWLTSMGAMDPLGLSPLSLVARLLAIAVTCAGVELIPVGDDNWTVPLSAAVLSALLLK